ncbi:MAG: nucleotidyltransferase domain-containing protein [Candidatus Margulisbacteria bacterium]|jgi:predicted nucleotidyltransferase|nr:nucleotidyltransferase domain-containing protein [Candidatus Margulisiibacteriota bacterium]
MSKAAVLKLFKKLVSEEELDNPQIYLFGSRARKDYTKDSDWDFLIVSDKKIPPRKTMEVKRNLSLKFHDNFLYPLDIIIKDKKTFSWEKNMLNTISYAADKEGLAL